MDFPPLVLASNSPRRSELLRGMGVEFTVIPSDATEIHNEELTAQEVAQLNAYRKARAVAIKLPEALVLGADTLVYLDTSLFGKPASLHQAFQMLSQLQGRTHEVATGVCLIHHGAKKQSIFVESTSVKFRPLDSKQIQDYLDQIDPLDKAGAYAVQEHADEIVESISGSFSNVVGLPLERLREVLHLWGIRQSPAARQYSPGNPKETTL